MLRKYIESSGIKKSEQNGGLKGILSGMVNFVC